MHSGIYALFEKERGNGTKKTNKFKVQSGI